MNKNLVGLTAGVALMGLVPGALHAAAPARSGGGAEPAAQKRAGRLLADAREALARGAPAAAVNQAETAVALKPRDAQARALLGRAYLAAGRFRSAETMLGDALKLDPSLNRAAVGRALALIALGQPDAAGVSLEAAEGGGADADIGLALALLGREGEAIDRLQAAAREAGADARIRQNLALAYALAGQWDNAATVAAQDVPPELLADRLHRWAMIGQLRNDPAMQVGALLGVSPAADAGLSPRLALADPAIRPEPAGPPLELAQAAPFELPPVATSIIPAVTLDGGTPVTQTNFAIAAIHMVSSSPAATPVPATFAVPAASILAPIADPSPVAAAFAGPPRMRDRKARIAEIKPVSRPASVIVRTLRIERRVTGPRPIRLVSRTLLRPLPAPAGDGWSVQLGAFSSAARTEQAWARLRTSVSFLAGQVPTGSKTRRGKALFHRLSVGGLATRADAIQLCLKVRQSGGACFVRRSSGDRPLTWAMRPKPDQAV